MSVINLKRIRDTQRRLTGSNDYAILGVSWDKSANPRLVRTDSALGMVANVGIDSAYANNHFDGASIYKDITETTDSLGNKFIRIPKFYIRKTDGVGFKTWQISKKKYAGFYLPWCFWDFANGVELPYIDVGKYTGSKTATKLQSVSGAYPLINTNIVDMRTFAQNNNAGGLLGYQQLDIHVVDLLQTLFYIEFATLDSQSVMAGYTSGQYSATHVATVNEAAVNRVILSNAFANLYEVGQSISVGTSLGGNQICTNRTITSIDVYDASSKAITFDGATVDIAKGNIAYNSGYKSGKTDAIIASSGSYLSNSSGKHSCKYRGIENPFGDVWQFIDGLNITDHQSWVCKNAAQYASNVFASPYEQLNYVNANVNNYFKTAGYDANYPFASLPTEAQASNGYYSDYYYQDAGQRIALFGGSWDAGAYAGLSYWYLAINSSLATLNVGGRLLKKPL